MWFVNFPQGMNSSMQIKKKEKMCRKKIKIKNKKIFCQIKALKIIQMDSNQNGRLRNIEIALKRGNRRQI